MANLFDNLNFQQQEAVKEIEKPLLIIAGAGSGKTLTVASKIAYLIEQGVKADSILALAFNEKAAEELKERVLGMVVDAEDLCISTFHSFCNQFIHDNILYTKLNANFRVITQTAQLVYLTKNINSFGIQHLEFNHEPYTLADEMAKFISRCKDEFISPADIAEYIGKREKESLDEEAKEDLNCLKDIHKIYRAYEEYKLENNLIDFGDMLCTVYNVLKSKPLILKRYQEKFQYVIVDEFQDTNYIQLQIVQQIAAGHGHITVVGDDDQSIYRFRGAYLTNIAEFKKIFPNNTQIALEHNYRSTKKIVEVANKLIEKSPERTVKKLFTKNKDGENITVTETPNETSQANYILETVKELLSKYPPQDIAILCRRKATAEPIIKAFRKQGVRFNFVGEAGFFQEPIVKDITAYLHVISNPLECNAEIVRILNRPNYGIKQVEICKFNCYASEKDISLYEAFDQLSKIDVDKFKFIEVKKTLSDIINSKKRHGTLDLIHSLLFEREFYKYEIALENNRNIQLINQFYTFAEEFNRIYPDNDIEDFTEYLSFASNFEIEEQNLEEQSVVISTIHGVKGMQYPVVIIPDLVDNKLPTRFQKDKFAIPKELLKGIQSQFDEKELHTQEERRLFYVAITRAKEKLILTYAKRYGENKTDSKTSKFLKEIEYQQNQNITFQQADAVDLSPESTTKEDQIQAHLMKQILSNLNTAKYSEAIENVLLYAKATNKNVDIKKLIAKIKEPDYTKLSKTKEAPVTVSETHGFSVSQFVGYKKCPRLYMYRHVMMIPEKPKYYFDFGSTLHSIAEQLTKMQKYGQAINEAVALELLAKHWDPKGYKSKIDEKRDYEQAKAILRVFLDEQANCKTEIVDIERWFETSIGTVKLRGRIDRIDKDGSNYTVVDYKTSKKATSLNELKKDMQMLVYAFAVRQIYPDGGLLRVGNWFLRTNEKVFFEPAQEAIEAMQAEIADMALKIKAASFEPKKGTWVCTQCDYKCLCD